jgi:excisionase family DNA binding protein
MAQERRVRERRRFRSSPASRTHPSSSRALTSDPAWLTVSQLCRRWQLGRKTIYKFINAKALPAWKVGSHLYRVAVADVLRFEAQNRLNPK